LSLNNLIVDRIIIALNFLKNLILPMKILKLPLIIMGISVLSPTISSAWSLREAARVVSSPHRVAENTLRTGAKVLSGKKPPEAILAPSKNYFVSNANKALSIKSIPTNAIYDQAKKLASVTPATETIFDVSTFSQAYYGQLVNTYGQAAVNILQGKDPAIIIAAPLAAAIRHAKEIHSQKAKPLPPDVKAGLARLFSPAILNRARYTVGKVDISLPTVIRNTPFFGGSSNAVTVDNIIVFPYDPPSFAENPAWWAHEVYHVKQYAQWGVEDFALRYIKNSSKIEKEAKDVEKRLGNLAQGVKANPDGGHSHAAHLNSSVSTQSHTDQSPTEILIPAWLATPSEQIDPVVIQCVFPTDLNPVNYYGTKSGKIIVYHRGLKQWMHIGNAVPSNHHLVGWYYQTPNLTYWVDHAGKIMSGPFQIGHVESFKQD
jgi:hypothetical protein